ncbi:hypothetical protein SEA_BOOSTSEASON_74 [Mycobacterium phage BoostSeason]|uniref:Uncharacterized protein n=1 Tax=Mycobacterium phage Findley TaxID=2015882 RepID=A0A222ZPZ6_9CAUD|nr:hypothetical protein MILLY_75 [Mycobacterium phage Milly]YP_009951161.1 hypothetical protein I5G77_gp75 [Mycobacterium phage Findley]AOZ64411.1 hypothetical protein SEA_MARCOLIUSPRIME_74 [Mycobacterium phage Marcoliusprime]ASR86617.1 hypothetical protein SEA_DISMALFUNK_75 [Mycobacterium phage DismalFunk]AYB69028.1 hypothetical protein SEA_DISMALSTRESSOR_75 [Mycobacterium phage DismalStressor]AYN57247.1 hypothetical protein SEA_BOOSTSEASON_74 [Mycobacterium phage BoostSeason]AJA43747.1 hypo
MMADRIELSDVERQAAYCALSPLLASVALNRSQPDYALGPVVDAVVSAINEARRVKHYRIELLVTSTDAEAQIAERVEDAESAFGGRIVDSAVYEVTHFEPRRS